MPSGRTMQERRHRGFSLIEIAMVLAIAAIIVAGALFFFTGANSAERTDEALEEVVAVQQAVHNLSAGQSDYSWLATTPHIAIGGSGVLPAKWVSGGVASPTGLKNPFGGTVTVANINLLGGSNNGFTISMTNITNDACNKMAIQDLGTTAYALSVSGGTFTSVYGQAMTPSAARTACGSSNNATMVWTLF